MIFSVRFGRKIRRAGLLLRLTILGILGAIAAAEAVFAQRESARRELLEIDSFLRRHLEEIPTPGFSVVLVEGSRTVFAGGYGVERLGARRAMSARSSVAIGSLTKSFTAVAVLQLAERGLIALDQPVTSYLPWFRTADRRSGEITVRMLLTNTSGIPSRDRWLFSRDVSERAIERGARALSSVPLVRAPGQSFEYSNENWSLLGVLISTVVGVPYSAYLQEHVLDPLEMTRSTTMLERFEPLGVLYGHFAGIDGVHEAMPRFLAEALPAGSELRASAEDMGHYLAMLLSGGVYRGRRILSEASVEMLFEPASHFRADLPEMGAIGVETGYGMGWAITEADGRTIVHHGGDAIVMGSWTALDRERGIAASVLYNGPVLDGYRYPSRISVANNLLHLMRGEPTSDFGLAVETDPTLNDFELPASSLERYVGTYLSADGQRAEILADETAPDGALRLEMTAGDLEHRYRIDFMSESSAALRNVSGAPLTRFLMTPDKKVTGLEGGLLGGVYRKRGDDELAGWQQVRSPDGRVAFSLPGSWELRWKGDSFEAKSPERPGVLLRGGVAEATAEELTAEEVIERRREELSDNETLERRSETVGGLLWEQQIWSEGDGAKRRQGLSSITEASGTRFEIVLMTPYGELTAAIRDLLVPLMSDLVLRGSL